MNRLKISIAASPETNDHMASILVDGKDWLGDDYIGLDPPRLFRQEALISGGRALVGRCTCGCEGCGDFVVDVMIEGSVVKWQTLQGSQLTFDRAEYESELLSHRNDHSWEDSNRTAERLVDAVFDSVVLKDGWEFDWSSARINQGKITLSFSRNGQQKLVDYGWDPGDPATAEKRARQLKREMENE